MCVAPIHMPGRGSVPCSKCWQCASNRIADKVGRALAEAKSADLTAVLTLTYNRDHPEAAARIQKQHFQRFMKNLRKVGVKDGFTVRYMAAAEHGTRNERVHFHAALFFKGKNLPTFEWDEEKWTWEHWGFGFTFAQKPSFNRLRYICKYMQKDTANRKQLQANWFTLSKFPPLGTEHFEQEAERWAKAGLAPRSPTYTIDGDHNRKKARSFYLTRTSSENFCRAFVKAWKKHQPGRDMPWSDYVENHLEAEFTNNPMHMQTELERSIKAKSPLIDLSLPSDKMRIFDDRAVMRDTVGRWWQRRYSYAGLEEERRLYTWTDLRAALSGRL